MSDYSSITEKGTVVTAKRGFQIIRHRHQGRPFVNSSALNANHQKWTGFSKPIPDQMKFVTQKNPAGRKNPRKRSQTTLSSEQQQEGEEGEEEEEEDEDGEDEDEDKEGRSYRRVRSDSKGTRQTGYQSGAAGNFEEQRKCNSRGLAIGTADFFHPWAAEHASCLSSTSADESSDIFSPWNMFEDYRWFDESTMAELSYHTPRSDDDQDLEDWSLQGLQSSLPEHDKRFFNFYINCLYPALSWRLETAQSAPNFPSESCRFLISDPLALECALSIGALFHFIETGGADVVAFASYCARLCALVNQILTSNERSTAKWEVAIQAVSSLATVSVLIGNYDDWGVHMQGLCGLVESYGGQEQLLPNTRALVRKADLVGSVTLFAEPKLPFIRFVEPASYAIPTKERQKTREVVIRSLLGTGITTDVVESFVALAHYIQAVDYALSLDGKSKLDVDALAEDWLGIQHRLLTMLSPVQNRELVFSSLIEDEKCNPKESRRFSCSRNESRPKEHLQREPCDESGGIEALTNALRLTGLLCTTLHSPNLTPCKPPGLLEPLRLLLRNMRTILRDLNAQALVEGVDLGPQTNSGGSSVSKIRPALLWICLGAEYGWTTWKPEEWCQRDLSSDYVVIRQLLVKVIGSPTTGAAPVIAADLELCRVLKFTSLDREVSNERESIMKIMELASISKTGGV